MKKLKCISILLSFLLMFAVCAPVFAEESALAEEGTSAEVAASDVLSEEQAKTIYDNLTGLAVGYKERYEAMKDTQKAAADESIQESTSEKFDFTGYYDYIIKILSEIRGGITYTNKDDNTLVDMIDVLGNALYYAETVTSANGEIEYQISFFSRELIGVVTLNDVLFSEEYKVMANGYIDDLREYKAIENPTLENIEAVEDLLKEIQGFLNSQREYIVRDIATESIQMAGSYKQLLSALPEDVGEKTAFNYPGLGAVSYNALLDQAEGVIKLSNKILAPESVTLEVYEDLVNLKDHPYGWGNWNNAWAKLTEAVTENAEAAIKDAVEKGVPEKNIVAYTKALNEFKAAYAAKNYTGTATLAVSLKNDVKTFGNTPEQIPAEGPGGNTIANADTNVEVQKMAVTNPGTGSDSASGILGVVLLCGLGIGIGAFYLRKKHSL